MQLARAVIYRLFAPTNAPHRSLKLRGLAFVAIVMLLGWMAVHIAPARELLYEPSRELALLCVTTYFFTSVLYVLSNGAHKTSMQRLNILQYMPIKQVDLRIMQLLAYAPVTLAGAVIIIPAIYISFATSLGKPLAFVAACQVLLRTAGDRLSSYAQLIGTCCMGGSLLLAWQLSFLGNTALIGQYITLFILLIHAALMAYTPTRPPQTLHAHSRISNRREQGGV